jgi:hypothetical protein
MAQISVGEAESQETLLRATKNQTSFRDVNERILRLSASAPWNEIEFECECPDIRCTTLISMTRQEYRSAHPGQRYFVLLPDHEVDVTERTVERTERYLVIEKLGDAGDFAEAQLASLMARSSPQGRR